MRAAIKTTSGTLEVAAVESCVQPGMVRIKFGPIFTVTLTDKEAAGLAALAGAAAVCAAMPVPLLSECRP